jgi:2-amino-4-hydroxy-6-hydroxymethyldihydropteridine diphosphokinase
VRIAYIGLGSNVGDRLANLRAAREALEARGVQVTASSSVYETEPVEGARGQRDFLNACLRAETELPVERLLEICKAIESELGRPRRHHVHAPRPIDLDLLLLGDERRSDERVTLPHPDILERRFVLIPLLELDPELALPDGRGLGGALGEVTGQRVDRVGPL